MSSVNEIPNGWLQTTIGELVELAQGVAINAKTNYVLTDKENGIPLLKINNLLNNTIDQYANPELVPKQSIIHKNDIIFTRTGQVGEVLINKYGILHNNSFKVIPNKELHWSYLYWYLKDIRVYNYVQKVAAGSVQKDLNHGAFKTIEFKYPKDIEEQKAIANILTAFDDKIENLQAQNKTLEQTAQTIFKEWFGKYQIGDELPDGWRVGKLGDVIEIFDSQRIPLSKSQREEKKGEFRYYGATSIMDYVDEYLFDGIYLLLAEDGSVMDDEGYPFLQYVWGKFWVNNHAHILTGKYGFSTEILYLFCRQMRVAGIVTGAVQLKINQKNLLGFELVIPPDQTLSNLDELIQPFFQKLRLNSDQIQSLKKTRDTLLPKLMSGQLRVKMSEL